MEPGYYISKAVIPADFLAPTDYEIRILATVFNVRMCIPYPGIRISLNVEPTGRANHAYVGDPIRGKLAPLIPWFTLPLQNDIRIAGQEPPIDLISNLP
jgi:hypothetical protein